MCFHYIVPLDPALKGGVKGARSGERLGRPDWPAQEVIKTIVIREV
jgi:hypothetical protein